MYAQAIKTNWLYCLVGLGMGTFSRLRFRLRVYGADRLNLARGTILVSTHRSDFDVPLVCGIISRKKRYWRPGLPALAFVVRDDHFEPGYIAGYTKGLPLWLRRLLWRVSVGEVMDRQLHCLPVRADRLRLVQVLRAVPQLPLRYVLPERLVPSFLARAKKLGLPLPDLVEGVINGNYADLLWVVVERSEFPQPELSALWKSRQDIGLGDMRRVGTVIRNGGVLLNFPEGQPSPDGRIGPIRGGMEVMVRLGKPRLLQLIALAYDPLPPGRTRAYMSVSREFPPPAQNIDERLLEMLRYLTPLTIGQAVATFVSGGGSSFSDLMDLIQDQVEAAEATGRMFEPQMKDPNAERLIERTLKRALAMGPEHPDIKRLAVEFEEVKDAKARVLGSA